MKKNSCLVLSSGLEITPDDGKITKAMLHYDKVADAERCLIDNGIDKDEAAIVLQALGYILLNAELYPETK